MRDRVVAATLILFAAWFVVRGVPFLGRGRPAVWATPTSEAYDRGQIVPVTVPGGGRVCATQMPWGPRARFVEVRVRPAAGTPAPALAYEATAPGGYRATGSVPAGLPRDGRAIAEIAPAPREVFGTLCVVNRGTAPLDLYGVPRSGRFASASTITVGGRKLEDRDLSILLLSNPHQSIAARLGDVLGNVAAFRPAGPWLVWALFALALLGVPVAVATAVARAARADGSPPSGPPSDPT
jgi:hypothetical protein